MARGNILTDFTVTGSGPFPFDMLRYDRCYPVGSTDALAIPDNNKRSIRLRTEDISNITEARWASFVWTVSDIRP